VAADLVAAGAEAGLITAIATGDRALGERLGADRVVGTDEHMAVRSLQLEGYVVALVTSRRSVAVGCADVAIGVTRSSGPVPWGADLLCGDDPSDLVFILAAFAAARRASSESVWVAAGGAAAAATLAFASPLPRTGRRVMRAVNTASLLSIANAARIGYQLAHQATPDPHDDRPWHAMDSAEVLGALGSALSGLTEREAARRRRPPPSQPLPAVRLGRLIAEELANPLTPLLLAGAGLSAVTGSFSDAALVTGVMGANAVFGGAQRYRAETQIGALGRTARQMVRVIRGGRSLELQGRDLVEGDVVRLGAGEAVPADCRILEAQGLEVDESSLTGESLPVAKHPEPSFASALADRKSMLYDGTSIAAGSALGVVVASGRQTEAMRGLEEAERSGRRTGVEARLSSLTRRMIPVCVAGGAAVTATGLLRGYRLANTLATGTSLTVAAVPEGLPLIATAAQTTAARRLSERGALVRHPRAIEALGRVDVVCADKTGTLTEGKIALRLVSDGERERALDDLSGHHRRILGAALRATPEDASRHPTDAALGTGASRCGVSRGEAWPCWRRRVEIPFEPGRGYHAVLGSGPGGQILSVKGAPEVVIPRCTTWTRPIGTRVLGDTDRAALLRELDRLARRGMRVLAVAERPAWRERTLGDPRVGDLGFLGYVAFADPVRGTALEAVDGLRAAGVDVVMITGDHPSTAEGIASELGILNAGDVLTGPELDAMSDAALDQRLPHLSVFARVTPAHKVRIVRAYQRAGRVVAMTGDGANDAPAIRLADVGIALGERSTSAARDAADVIVVDDRIETIVDAVLEGRAMWMSVRDAVGILIGGNLGEIAFTVAGSLVPGPPPLNARQLLLVNLFTDAFPAMAIAVRPPVDVTPEDLFREGPDKSLGPALDRAIAWRAITTAAGAGLAYLIGRLTGTPGRARTIAFVALTGTQLGQTIAVSGGDRGVLASAVGSAAAMVVVTQTPGLSYLFGCRPLGPLAWATAIGSAAAATGASIVLLKASGRVPRPGIAEVTPIPASTRPLAGASFRAAV
jgi:cation-transporting ATPase I